MLRSYTIFLLFILLTISSCKSDDNNRPSEANLYSTQYYIKGNYEQDSYTFCGFVPSKVDYNYKQGKWKFWNLDGHLFAEGKYKTVIDTVDNHGGCTYSFKKGEMDLDTWSFYDKKGNLIPNNYNTIQQIKNCYILPHPNDKQFQPYGQVYYKDNNN